MNSESDSPKESQEEDKQEEQAMSQEETNTEESSAEQNEGLDQAKLKNIIEAALMVSEKPVNLSQLLALFDRDMTRPERADIKAVVEKLKDDYIGRGIELSEVASGYRIQVNGEYADWINQMFEDRPPRYSRALLETLAIIAYRQPLTRAEIEEIRGVSVSSNIIRTLQERNWIRVVGQRDIPGKPELLATTKEFLDYFNLKKLSELPSLSEIKDFDQINPDLFEELEKEVQAKADAEKQASEESKIESSQEADQNDDAINDEDSELNEIEVDAPEAEGHQDEDSEENSEENKDNDNVVPFG